MAATITEQLTKLNQLRQQLAANLTAKGISASASEKFNTLVPKVLEISGGESLYRPACRFLQCKEQLCLKLRNNRFWMGL